MGWDHKKCVGRCGGKVGGEAYQTQEMKGKQGSGDLEGREAKSRLTSSGHTHDTSRKRFFC